MSEAARWFPTSQQNLDRWLDDTPIPAWILLRIRDEAPEMIVADPAAPYGTVPVVGYVSAGETSIEYDDQGYPTGAGFDDVPRPRGTKDPHCYALRVRGDSMEPVYMDGETIVLDTTKPVHDKNHAVVRVGGKTYFKIYRQVQGRITLQSFNREHPEITCSPEEITFKHRVVQVDSEEREEKAP